MQMRTSRSLSHALKTLVLLLSILVLNGCGGLGGAPDTSAIGTANGGVDIPTPARISFTSQPVNSTVGAKIAPGVKVSLIDQNGNPLPLDKGNVVMTLSTKPPDAKLKGTISVSVSGGVASFDDLTLNQVGGYELQASYLTPTNQTVTAVSNAFNVTGIDLSNSTWSSVNPNGVFDNLNQQNVMSGRATAIVAASDAKTIYLGTAGGGLWKTIDAGKTWNPLTDGQTFSAIGCLATDPSNPGVIFVGTGEPNNNVDAKYGDGIYKTSDGGSTFTRLTGSAQFKRVAVSRIVVSRQDPNLIFAGTHNGGGNTKSQFIYGVYRSTDGGQTFTNITAAAFGTKAQISDLIAVPAASAGSPDTLFACVDGVVSPAGGIWRSSDNGNSWTKSISGLPPALQMGRIAIGSAPSNPDVMYAWIGDFTGQSVLGLYASKNRGTSWALVNVSGLTPVSARFIGAGGVGAQSFYNWCVAIDPGDPFSVYLGAIQSARVSGIDLTASTGALTYVGGDDSFFQSDVSHPHVDCHAFAFGPNPANSAAPPSLYAATDGGIFRLDNPLVATPATAWDMTLNVGNLASLQFNSIAAAGLSTGVLGGTQDNGSPKFPSGGVFWDKPFDPSPNNLSGYGDGGACLIDQSDDQMKVFSYPQGSFVEVLGGVFRNALDSNVPSSDFMGTQGAPLAGAFLPPITLLRDDPKRTLAVASYRIFETTQNDANAIVWKDVSSQLVQTTNDYATTDYFTSLSYGADQSTLYAVSRRGKVFSRTSAGGAFTDRTNSVFPQNVASSYNAIAVDPADPEGNTAYVSFNGFQNSKVFKTTDHGQNWKDVTFDLPDSPVNCLIVHSSGSLFLGNDNGVYELGPGAKGWLAFNPGFPTVSVFGLDISEKQKRIVAGTHGRCAFWAPLP